MRKMFRTAAVTIAVAGAAFAGVGLEQALDGDARAAQREPDRTMRDDMRDMERGGHMRGMEQRMERHMKLMERHMERMERMMERHMEQGDGS